MTVYPVWKSLERCQRDSGWPASYCCCVRVNHDQRAAKAKADLRGTLVLGTSREKSSEQRVGIEATIEQLGQHCVS